jgi:hypothetical protein
MIPELILEYRPGSRTNVTVASAIRQNSESDGRQLTADIDGEQGVQIPLSIFWCGNGSGLKTKWTFR